MKITEHIASHFRQLHFGENWTSVNMKEVLSDLDWIEATTKLYEFNTVATLVYHTNYYVVAVMKVLRGGILDAKDTYSFQTPHINSAASWQHLLNKIWADADEFAKLVEALPQDMLTRTFSDEKYGTYYRNLHGIIEHSHYHLGQMVLIKKMLRAEKGS